MEDFNMWLYKENLSTPTKQITKLNDFPQGCIGFIYRIYHMDSGRFYIGKKILNNTNNVKLGKKAKKLLAEKIIGSGRRPSKVKVVKESNWLDYWGSSKELTDDINTVGKDKFVREIIEFCYSKKQLSYYEIKYQILHQVIEKPELSYNRNMLGKFFPADLK